MTTEQLLKQISDEISRKQNQFDARMDILRQHIVKIEIKSPMTNISSDFFDEGLKQELFNVVRRYIEDDVNIKEQELIKLNDPLEIAMRIKKSQEQ